MSHAVGRVAASTSKGTVTGSITPGLERLRLQIEAIELPSGFALGLHGEDTRASEANEALVVLGALATILGVAPLLFDPFFQSMAVTIVFGLAFATLFYPIVLPPLYAVLFRIQPDGPA